MPRLPRRMSRPGGESSTRPDLERSNRAVTRRRPDPFGRPSAKPRTSGPRITGSPKASALWPRHRGCWVRARNRRLFPCELWEFSNAFFTRRTPLSPFIETIWRRPTFSSAGPKKPNDTTGSRCRFWKARWDPAIPTYFEARAVSPRSPRHGTTTRKPPNSTSGAFRGDGAAGPNRLRLRSWTAWPRYL